MHNAHNGGNANAGNNCVDPNEANLKNGLYPLTHPQYVVLSKPGGNGSGLASERNPAATSSK